MRIKPKEIEINPSSPFENDLLNRQEEIENLTRIIQNVEHPLVLAINAPWGTGKTTFIRLWEAYLKQNNFESICFNAWETDFAEDPLIPLVSKLDDWVRRSQGYPIQKWSNDIRKLMPALATKTLLTGVKVATYGLIQLDSDKIKEILADFSGEAAGDIIEKFNEKTQANEDFKNLIGQALEKLPENKNLIIFIDELDRCRPNYAIELLERVKHLFNIERLVFVLSTDTEQLAHSICAVYGNNFDSKKYLNRFIDLEYSLKEPDLKKYINSNFEILSIKDYYLKQEDKKEKSYHSLLDLIFFFARRLKLKLRDINFLIGRFALILSSTPKKNPYFYPKENLEYEPILLTLTILRNYNHDLYQNYQLNYEKTEVIQEIIDFLSQGMSESEAVTFSSINMNSNDADDKYNFAVAFIKICVFLIAFSGSPKEAEKPIVEYCMKIIANYAFPKLSPSDSATHSNNYGGDITFTNIMEKIKQTKYYYDPRGFNNVQLMIDHIELSHRININ